MDKLKLDKNYNIVEKKNIYSDSFVESIDLINQAQSHNLITASEASFLYKVVVKKEIKKEAKTIVPFASSSNEIHSFFMNMKSKQIKHA